VGTLPAFFPPRNIALEAHLTHRLQTFWRDESGPEMVEWAVVTLVLLVATVAVLIAMRDTLIDMFKQAFDKLEAAPPSTFP
jgi:Flp pilus assembly pilin Flp